MKIRFFLALFTVSFFIKGQSGFVHVEKNELVDGNNKKIELNGVNLGGWLLWEGWIWGAGFNKEGKIYSKLEEVVGKDEAKKFRQAVYEKYITEKDIQKISELCLNVVRIPFNHHLLEDDSLPYQYKSSGWKILDTVLSWCEKYQVYAVLDLHGAPGGQSNIFISDPDRINLWKSEENKKRTIALWKAIAQRYVDRKIIAGYDLLNEPSVNKGEQLIALYNEITHEIREVDKNHLLMLEGNARNRIQRFSDIERQQHDFQFSLLYFHI